jgi:hypothetical protein
MHAWQEEGINNLQLIHLKPKHFISVSYLVLTLSSIWSDDKHFP